MKRQLQRVNPAGLIMSGSGMSGEMEGPIEVFFAGALGALAGFVFGLLAGAVSRVLTLNRAKGILGGPVWAAYGAGAGGVALAIFEILN